MAGPRHWEAGEGRGPEAIGPECPRPGASRKRRLALRPVDIEAGLRGSRLKGPPGRGLCAAQKPPSGSSRLALTADWLRALTLERPLDEGADTRGRSPAGLPGAARGLRCSLCSDPFKRCLHDLPGFNGARVETLRFPVWKASSVHPHAGLAMWGRIGAILEEVLL